MARINTISDGQPFTYQLLNNIIEAVNDIKIPEGDDADTELVKIVGPGLGSKNKPMIIFDRDSISIPENQTGQSGKATFRTNFNNENPIVIASLVDNQDGGATPIGYLVVTSVTNKSFEYRVKLIRKRTKSTNMEINYVAIGVTSK